MTDPKLIRTRGPVKGNGTSFAGLSGLSRMSILIGLGPIDLAEAAKRLVPKALHGAGKVFSRSAEISKTLAQGIEDGSCIESHRGAALLHLRVEGLAEPRAALGISSEGMGPERVYATALFLSPKGAAGSGIPHWARKKLFDEKTLYRLRTAADLESVCGVLSAERQEGE
ncbi:MAG: hypothetical protein WC728_07135 [Elusimicrobiota bacterium]